MATIADTDDITVAEFSQLEEYLFEQLRDGVDLFHIEELVHHTNHSDGKVYEGMAKLVQQSDRVSNVGAGVWQIDLPDDD